ncbi:LPS export ABC transporter permease LptF [Oxalobacter aliiformigenes]|uniref:Lipopolysaccharide export system permease protein LptF n=1 Tax=Oxalobacter aliiformigenes TaxID=2946593 RepID=A0ABY7JH02_9BURK|nr:LPS export ABC transporter permease LptF [Oxalobacter aliiformigenes]WAV89096.1 LPS export ABC transporter permease LptF [Oxalobacter aliiformigenes]WAV93192.1 LPS export ABC transporter permease LptF [Oxalobacter aliiformigenes]WAV95304.1 LPS export ABC transporter permease LptF [Oxalobacter aliiformigenes]WAV96895.1 LPS export ABC transporter permease LptF [Oxalobacter aliiformigenes]
MIFQRALKRELFSTAAGVFLTLFTITITMMLIRILGQAAKGRVASEDVMALIGFTSLNYMPIILILTGFVSVLLVVTRSYQDSEMVVWFASGLSLTRWLRPVMEFAIPIVVLVTLLGFFVTPWAYRQSAEFRERFEKREDIARISPGKFQESAAAQRVFFVEKMSDDLGKVKNVFINSTKNGEITTVVSQNGTVETNDKGEKFVVLEDGMRYQETPDQSDFRIMEFEKYTAYIAPKGDVTVSDISTRSMTTMELLTDANSKKMGELVWRIGLPFMSVLLMLLAIPLGFVNPRAGRSFNLIIAVLLYMTYSNLSSFIQAYVSQNKLAFGLAWWPLHLIVALIILLLFALRLGVNSKYHPYVLLSAMKHKRLRDKGNRS